MPCDEFRRAQALRCWLALALTDCSHGFLYWTRLRCCCSETRMPGVLDVRLTSVRRGGGRDHGGEADLPSLLPSLLLPLPAVCLFHCSLGIRGSWYHDQTCFNQNCAPPDGLMRREGSSSSHPSIVSPAFFPSASNRGSSRPIPINQLHSAALLPLPVVSALAENAQAGPQDGQRQHPALFRTRRPGLVLALFGSQPPTVQGGPVHPQP